MIYYLNLVFIEILAMMAGAVIYTVIIDSYVLTNGEIAQYCILGVFLLSLSVIMLLLV